MDYSKFLIKDYKFWQLYLHDDQTLLGRTYVWLKRDNIEDIFDVTEEELKEYWLIIRTLRDVIKKLWGADMFNYATLQNVTHHVHTHIIPRYSHKVEFAGELFEDTVYGRNYSHSIAQEHSGDVKMKIKEEIENLLKSLTFTN